MGKIGNAKNNMGRDGIVEIFDRHISSRCLVGVVLNFALPHIFRLHILAAPVSRSWPM